MTPVYALWDRDRFDADGEELLRWLVAAHVAGRAVVLIDRAGIDLPSADLDGEAAALRDALVDAGARFLVAAPGEWPSELASADDALTIHRLAPR